MSPTIPTNVPSTSPGLQENIRLSLPLVEKNADYERMAKLLLTMDELLESSGAEGRFMDLMVAEARIACESQGRSLGVAREESVRWFARRSLRCMIARILSGESFRDFSVHLADSHLLRHFCRYDGLGEEQSPSKSTLNRMAESTSESDLGHVVQTLLTAAASPVEAGDEGVNAIGLTEAVNLGVVLADSTCLELDIHFPVDWVLLRDGVRSLVKAIEVIRSHGLKHRIARPQSFLTQINTLCIKMTASNRHRGSKKERKKTFRSMKKVAQTVLRHGERYLNLLHDHWQETDLTEGTVRLIEERLQRIIDLLPQAIAQAHQRIIQEKKVENADKILSLYQPHAAVYVRHKAGAPCEFGLQCLVIENTDGLIMDWSISEEGVASDSRLLVPAMERLRQQYGEEAPSAVVTDRGFASTKNSNKLSDMDIADFTLPRSPNEMAEAMKDPTFAAYQKRRSQTESRIGIFKNNFVGGKILAPSLEGQKRHVAWAALAHNCWVLARMLIVQEEEIEQAA